MKREKNFKKFFSFLKPFGRNQNLNSIKLILIGLIWTLVWISNTGNVLAISAGISWKKISQVDLSTLMIEGESLQKAIQRFIEHYATDPQHIIVDPAISGNFSTFDLTASSINTAFHWLLTRHELSVIFKEEHWLILPKKEVWHRQPYRKLVSSPLSLEQVLDDLATTGQISITFDRVQAQQQRIHRNLIYPTVEAAIRDLVWQFKWSEKYDPDFHTLHLIEEGLIETQSLLLTNIRQSQVEQFFDEATPLFRDLRRLDIFYPSDHILMLKGQKREIETVFSAVKNFDHAHSVIPQSFDFHFETILLKSVSQEQVQGHLQPILQQDTNLTRQLTIKWQESESSDASEKFTIVSLYGDKPSVQKLTDIIKKLDQIYSQPQSLVVDRINLNYLHVNTKTIVSSGQEITSEGVETKLQQIFQKLQIEETGVASSPFQIIPDFISNAIILRGTPEQIQVAKKILEIWDKPQPTIRIEAHIFETSDIVSREL